MKILQTLFALIVTFFSLGSNAQNASHLTMTKLLDITTGFPDKKQKEVIEDLTTNLGFKTCEVDKVSSKNIVSKFRLCKTLSNGANSDDFNFKGGSNKKDEIVSFVEYRILDANGSQAALYESQLKSAGFTNTYSDKEVKKFKGAYNGRDLIINVYSWGNYREIKINNDPSY